MALKKYLVSAEVTISVHTEVEADSPDAAVEIAAGRDMQGFCHSCSSGRDTDREWRFSGELDGEAVNLEARQV